MCENLYLHTAAKHNAAAICVIKQPEKERQQSHESLWLYIQPSDEDANFGR